VVGGLYETEQAMKRKTVELVHEGKYAAEVLVELIEEQGGWSPYFSFEDAQKLEAVRLALRQGDIAEAAKYGRVFELTPVAATCAGLHGTKAHSSAGWLRRQAGRCERQP
jgi:hypothetical protein